MVLNRRSGRLPEGHDIASSGPCKGPGVGGNRRERSQGRWSEWRRDQQVGGSRPWGWRERFFSRPPGGSTGHREPTWVPGSPAVRDPSPGQSGNSSLPGYQLCAHHLLSNYYVPSPVLGGSGPPHPREERAMPPPRPQRPGEVASAVSCHPAGQLVSARPSAFPPTGVSCLCSTRPAPSPGDSLAGGRKCFPPPDAGAPHGTRPNVAAPACLEHLAWRQAPEDHRRPRRTQGHSRPVVSGTGACDAPGTIRPPCAGLSNGDVLTHLLFLPSFLPVISPPPPLCTISLVSLFVSASPLPLSFFFFLQIFIEHLLCTRVLF
ncbi:uncharacterized protein LOC122213754 [Panthera leo]|uniref:uncharacterized protein LOC122213754 n=1 Tax=Panthera leo TaxID=9689 RepID=UPI001C69B25B|nr:uncharacterized protein LOC122213754 [Panthera leo]